MADSITASAPNPTDAPINAVIAETGQATDWKAKYEAMREHSRDWEKQAKANKAAADELEKLKAAQLTEKEQADRRAEKAEAELAALKERAEHDAAIAKVAMDEGVPSDVVSMLSGKDAEELSEQVQLLKKLLPAYPTRTDDGGTSATAKKNTAELFADALGGRFK